MEGSRPAGRDELPDVFGRLVGRGRATGRRVTALAAVLWTVAGAGSRRQHASAALELSAARFYRGATAQTLVDVFCRIPLELLAPVDARTGSAAYRIAVSVRDSGDLELLRQSWSQAVAPGLLNLTGASTAEHFAFAARRGRYTVEVAVTDSATGRVTRRRMDVSTFATTPRASDLLLADDLRRSTGAADSAPRDGEVRKGPLFVRTSGHPVLTPSHARLGYYLELYPARAESVTVRLLVKGADGNQIVATAPQPAVVGAEGGVTSGIVDLAGLPPGGYRLDVVASLPESAVVRSAAFGMAGFATETTMAAVTRRPPDVFSDLSEPELDSLYAPLVYLMREQERGIYSSLTPEGKRGYLRRFWVQRDPSPGTAENEARDAFYAAVTEASRRFREGGAAEVPGWRTDRGRIFIRYGAPDEVLERRQAGNTSPYEVWKYTRVRPRKFLFVDLTRFGNYSLVWTDERREPSRPDWKELLGLEAVQDVERF